MSIIITEKISFTPNTCSVIITLMMNLKKINDIQEWLKIEEILKEKGYFLYQMQYRWNDENGFLAWFMKDEISYSVVTYDETVQTAIVKYRDR